MKHWHEEMPFTADNSLAELIFTENSLFFDIETTGFSAARTSLYLIGCAARKENLLIVDQFFAETPQMNRMYCMHFWIICKILIQSSRLTESVLIFRT